MFVEHICVIFLCLFVIEKVKCQEIDCAIEDGSEGVCVEIDKCPSLQSLLLGAARPLPSHVVEKLKTHTCAFEDDKITPKVCCMDKIFTTVTPTPFTPTQVSPTEKQPAPSTTTASDPNIGNRNDVPDDASDHPNLYLLPMTTCGDNLVQRVSNGNKTDLFEYPWMAQLRYETGGKTEGLCGASLISERYVLTAAHCIDVKSTNKLVAVRLGDWDTSTDIDCQILGTDKVCAPPVQDILIEETFVHPMYNRPRYANDIGVIRLAKPADMTAESVKPICLPTTYQAQKTVPKRVVITGWGLTETLNAATILLQASLPIVSNEVCQEFFKRSIRLTPMQMCAGGEIGIDSCLGDSGGPLFFPTSLNGARMVQYGVVSIGVPVCSDTNNFPGIYVKIPYYMRWILDQMKP